MTKSSCATFLLMALFSSLQANDTTRFLDIIASAEPANWDRTIAELQEEFPNLVQGPNFAASLNDLAIKIEQQDQATTIHLLQRALRNYDALAQDKTAPITSYYKHYQPPPFLIPDIDLNLRVEANRVLVTTTLFVKRNGTEPLLILDGYNHNVLSVSVNGKPIRRELYRVTPNELILLDTPKDPHFKVSIQSTIDPYHNDSMEGLYVSKSCLITQCESEGARRIFYTLDRPDVLSRITTTIVADPKIYPVRLSNGNLIEESQESGNLVKIVWKDPIPKPSYLFACVLGNFSKLEDRFTTRSGREVRLSTFVEPGKESRATYSLEALKQAMLFDEQFFDREYDLDDLKMVAAPDFNSGAMENKGLMIFNETALLVDKDSGTDANFRRVATIIAHEYFHNWSGNRVTVRNWFEIALKEAFTDFRAMLFGEWAFGSALIRPKDVTSLREGQFPEETSEAGHPIMVESYVSPSSIYDDTTYVKGREVFRALQTYMDTVVPDGFRQAQNLYFSRYDGQAVTFRELLQASNEILSRHSDKNLSQFERWFTQQGTPSITTELKQEGNKTVLIVAQECIHPKTNMTQEPLLIPFSYELLREDGTVFVPKQNVILSEKVHVFEIDTNEKLVPIFLHNYPAPVILNYNYSLEELGLVLKHATDPFAQWEAGVNFSLLALQEENAPMNNYSEALADPNLPIIAKARLLRLPSIRAIAQKWKNYDFVALHNQRDQFETKLAHHCKPLLEELLRAYPEPLTYAPTTVQMEIRELRSACMNLLAKIDPEYAKLAYDSYKEANNFDTALNHFSLLVKNPTYASPIIDDFYNKWKDDRMVFNSWLRAQTTNPSCTVARLKELMATKGFDAKNPNHIRSIVYAFAENLPAYHDPNGEGYAFMVDQILEIQAFNPRLVEVYLLPMAFIDFDHLSPSQQRLMLREMKRLQGPDSLPETRSYVEKIVKKTT